jgi:hypothetical protein
VAREDGIWILHDEAVEPWEWWWELVQDGAVVETSERFPDEWTCRFSIALWIAVKGERPIFPPLY